MPTPDELNASVTGASTAPDARPKPDRIPALVVSGFLGSGKTTLVRRLLEQAQSDGLRVAFVSNELGELGVDRALLGEGGDAFVELEGGCVCCELSDDLVRTLQTLYEEVHPHRIVIETSGVALPFDTQLNFWRDPVRDWIGDDMAVVVVNAEQVAEGRDLEGTFEDQVSSADLLILNKVDLVPDAELAHVHAVLRGIEDEAPIVESTQGDVDPDLLFPPSADEIDRQGSAPGTRPHHHEQFETEIWEPAADLTLDAIEARLASEPELLRAKGFVRRSGALHVVQVVGRRVEITPVDAAPAGGGADRIVLIRRSDAAPIQHG
jgi:cobalamin biosynthesis protein CobW